MLKLPYMKVLFCSFIFLYSKVSSNTIPLKGCQGKMDMIFVVDGSDHNTPSDFNILKDTLIELVERLHIGQGGARMGLIVFSQTVTKEITVTGNQALLKREITNLKQIGTGVNIATGLQTMIKMFTDTYKSVGVPKIGTVIATERSTDPGQTIGVAFEAKNEGIRMNSIGVSTFADRTELSGIANADDKVLMVNTYQDLADAIGNVVTMVCPAQNLTTWIPPTTTTSTTTTQAPEITTPSRTKRSPISGPCEHCELRNGVGYNPHPEDCDKFIQCYFGENNEIVGAYRQCPWGQYWDQEVLTCRPAENVVCHKEKCRLPGLLSYPYGNIKNNRAYWKCNLGKSVSLCCPEGYLYRPYQGCVEFNGKTETCPPIVFHEGACDMRPVFGNATYYERIVHGNWIRMPCAPGTHYDPTECACSLFYPTYISNECKPELFISFDGTEIKDDSGKNNYIENHNVSIRKINGSSYGYFDGNSKIVIPRFANFESKDFVIKMNYSHTPNDRLESLISNGDDCCDNVPSMALVKSKRNVHYMIKTVDDKTREDSVATFHLPSIADPHNNWNEVYYIHDSLRLEGRSNGIRQEDFAVGKIKKTKAGLQIGAGRLFQNFTGLIDYVAVYLCRPSHL
ncbi:protein PIF-like [Mytilus edulis]|uniref:protein PIF-like n=1 Tax=Mytilus edulis TaxID=6550 RepID=UPI0039F0DBFB